MTLQNKTLKDKITIIINHYNIKNFDKVIIESEKLLKKNLNNDFLWNILGLTYQKITNYVQAENCLLRALQLNPKNLSAINNLGNNYKYIYNFNKAEEYFQKSLKIKPDYVSALVNYGNLKFELNKFKDALDFLNRALSVDSSAILIHLNLSLVYQAIGEFEKAIKHLKVINVLDPHFTRADKMMSALMNYNKKEDQHFELMQDKIKTLNLDDDQKIYLYFGLSKAFEDKGNFLKSFEHFEIGNSLKRKKSNYSIEIDKILFQKIKNLFNSIVSEELNVIPSEKKTIFILGMPRSGTTLVEQIVSSHKNVYGAGELNYLGKLIYKNLFDSNGTNFLSSKILATTSNLNNVASNYSDFLDNFNIKEDFITDKALLNFQWIGFIKILFPNAKIINCIRDPKENCLSIYKNLFDYEGAWCYDKNELVEYYSLYLDLMKFWEEKYPNTIHNIQYEDLVQNQNNSIKKLIESLGISWDKNCEKFYENKSAIKTLSVNQARKKIYSSSLSLYEKYKPFLKDFSKYFG